MSDAVRAESLTEYPCFSLLPLAPPGFVCQTKLAPKDLRLRPFALYAESIQSALSAIAGLSNKVYGVVVTPTNERCQLYAVTNGLWHFVAPAAHLAQMRGFIQGLLSLIDSVKAERCTERTLRIEHERTRGDLSALSEYIAIIDSRGREDFTAKSESMVDALTRLLHFAADTLSHVDGSRVPQVVVDFLFSSFAQFTGVAYLVQGSDGRWTLLCRRGEFRDQCLTIDPELATQAIWTRGASMFSSIDAAGDAHLLALTSNKPLHRFDKAHESFTRLFCTLLGATYRIKRTNDALVAEKECLDVTLRSIADGVITTDTQGQITLFNQVAEQICGLPRAEAVGRLLSSVLTISDEHRQVVLDLSTLVDRDTRAGGWSFRGWLTPRVGPQRLVSIGVNPNLDQMARQIGSVLILRDITEERRREEEQFKIEKLESLGILAGGIAHDFNNILTSIIANLSLSVAQIDPTHPSYRGLRSAETAALRARSLTQQLLTFSKGGAPIKKAISLGDLVVEAASFATPGANVRCEFNIPKNVRAVEVDSGQISQVLTNLVINATQAMPIGGVVKLAVQNFDLRAGDPLPLAPGPYVTVSVADDGPGIPPHLQAKVFDPYFTTKSNGSGLGLTSAYSIVKRHSGHLDFESSAGRGCVFRVILPALEQPYRQRHSQPPTQRSASGRVLLMDDDSAIIEVMTQTLETAGFDVRSTTDGRTAIVRYYSAMNSSTPFDVVIMDLTIPGGMGGRETLEKLRAIDPNVVAIVSSGYSNDPVMAEHQRYGFAGVLAKPYKPNELLRTVTKLVANQSKGTSTAR